MPAESEKRAPQSENLNPALRRRTETSYDTTQTTPAPIESASVQREEGRLWPWIWLVVTIACVMIAIYLIFF
jgi:hypothetical protein